MERVKPLKIDTTITKIWFTSDTHFGHQNILKFCERPFVSIEEMDNTIIERWNLKVGKDDIVFHLGDFAFATNKRWKELISLLNGKIYLILGNHDITRWPGTYTMQLFDRVENQMMLKIDNKYKVYLNHFPFLCYDGTYRNPEDCTIQLHGHVHERVGGIGKDDQRLQYRFPYQYDVGVDNNNFYPVSWEEILKIIHK
jgi:calcineurin-like phosphoesterase family protein